MLPQPVLKALNFLIELIDLQTNKCVRFAMGVFIHTQNDPAASGVRKSSNVFEKLFAVGVGVSFEVQNARFKQTIFNGSMGKQFRQL